VYGFACAFTPQRQRRREPEQIRGDNDFDALSDFLTYAFFDSSELPNFMKFLKSQGIEPRVARKIPHRCQS
jgi:hypothetical protein